MASEFITRVEHGKDEPYTVIFRTDDADKYKHIEDECRRMIGHEKPTVDAVQVVRCEKCRHGITAHGISDGWVLCTKPYVTDTVGNMMHRCDWFCADGERKDGAE